MGCNWVRNRNEATKDRLLKSVEESGWSVIVRVDRLFQSKVDHKFED